MKDKMFITSAGVMVFILLLAFCFPGVSYAWGEPPSSFTDLGTALAVSFIILVVFFLLMREITCWYFKINERLAVLKEIRSLLQELVDSTHNTDKQSIGSRPVMQDAVDTRPDRMAGNTPQQQ